MRDEKFMDYMMRRGAEGFCMLFRLDYEKCVTMVPPSITGLKDWISQPSLVDFTRKPEEAWQGERD